MKRLIWRLMKLVAIWDLYIMSWKFLELLDRDRKAHPSELVTLGPRAQLIWAHFLYETVSGYGPGELSHWYDEANDSY